MNFYVGSCGCPIPGGPVYYTVCAKHDVGGWGLQVPPAEHTTAEEIPAGRRSSAALLAPPGGRPDPGITDSQLAVLLRQAQWALDEAAHDFPAGRISAQRRAELADTLEALGFIVRTSAPEVSR